jgi:glycerophosphoryl diester phosphodiesterase
VIELKSGKQIVPVLAEELAKFRKAGINVLIITFDEAAVVECKTLMPQCPVHLLTDIDETASAKKIAQTVRRTKSDGVGMEANADVIDADFIAELKQHGCNEFHVWTVDDVADARHFRDLGAAGITTNKPAVIGAALRE